MFTLRFDMRSSAEGASFRDLYPAVSAKTVAQLRDRRARTSIFRTVERFTPTAVMHQLVRVGLAQPRFGALRDHR